MHFEIESRGYNDGRKAVLKLNDVDYTGDPDDGVRALIIMAVDHQSGVVTANESFSGNPASGYNKVSSIKIQTYLYEENANADPYELKIKHKKIEKSPFSMHPIN